jgi:outer membrane translocation and assembly module TamA
MGWRLFYSILFLWSISLSSFAQLSAMLIDEQDSVIEQWGSIDSLSFLSELEERIEVYKSDGHMLAGLDSLVSKDEVLVAHVYLGPRFNRNSDTLPDGRLWNGDERMLQRLLDEREDEGYPFFSLLLQRSLRDTVILEELDVTRGPLIVLDSILFLGDFALDEGWAFRYLGLQKGGRYSESDMVKVDESLRRLRFVNVAKPSAAVFSEEGARLFLALEERKADRVDGLIGFQPDEDGQVIFTGEFALDLYHLLNRGDNIKLSWRRIEDRTQSLEVGFSYPFLFNTPIGIEAGLQQFRQDTTFSELKTQVSARYRFGTQMDLKAFYRFRRSNDILSADEADEGSNARVAMIGFGLDLDSRNDAFNPDKGILFDLQTSIGDKELSGLTSDDEEVVGHTEVNLRFQGFLPVGKRSTFLLALNGSGMQSDVILAKERFRFGGLKSLRGVDEQSIRASSFLIATTEYRFLTGPRSYFSAFSDWSYYESDTEEGFFKDRPFGFGLGTTFQAASGLFTLNYALAARPGQGPDLRTGKIHFGFTAIF